MESSSSSLLLSSYTGSNKRAREADLEAVSSAEAEAAKRMRPEDLLDLLDDDTDAAALRHASLEEEICAGDLAPPQPELGFLLGTGRVRVHPSEPHGAHAPHAAAIVITPRTPALFSLPSSFISTNRRPFALPAAPPDRSIGSSVTPRCPDGGASPCSCCCGGEGRRARAVAARLRRNGRAEPRPDRPLLLRRARRPPLLPHRPHRLLW